MLIDNFNKETHTLALIRWQMQKRHTRHKPHVILSLSLSFLSFLNIFYGTARKRRQTLGMVRANCALHGKSPRNLARCPHVFRGYCACSCGAFGCQVCFFYHLQLCMHILHTPHAHNTHTQTKPHNMHIHIHTYAHMYFQIYLIYA